MENFLRSKEFWNLVEHSVPTTATGVVLINEQQKAIEDQTLKDLKANNYLFQAIDRSIMETILNKEQQRIFGTH